MNAEPAPLVFRQDPTLKSEEITLFPDKISIVLRGMGLSKTTEIRLSAIVPTPETCFRRFWPLFMVPLIYIVLIVIVLWQLEAHSIISRPWLIIGDALSLLFIKQLVSGIRPIEITKFRGTDGALLFEIYRPRRGDEDYSEFKDVLTKRLENIWERRKNLGIRM